MYNTVIYCCRLIVKMPAYAKVWSLKQRISMLESYLKKKHTMHLQCEKTR